MRYDIFTFKKSAQCHKYVSSSQNTIANSDLEIIRSGTSMKEINHLSSHQHCE